MEHDEKRVTPRGGRYTGRFGYGGKTAEQIIEERLAAFDADAAKSDLDEEQIKMMRDQLEHDLDTAASLVPKVNEPADFERISRDLRVGLEQREAVRNAGPVLDYPQMGKERTGTLVGPAAEQEEQD